MTDRMPWPLAPVGVLDGNTHNAIAVGPEGSGKTALINTIAARLVATKSIKRLSVISPVLSCDAADLISKGGGIFLR